MFTIQTAQDSGSKMRKLVQFANKLLLFEDNLYTPSRKYNDKVRIKSNEENNKISII